MKAQKDDALVHMVVGAAMKVHRHFGPGFAEVVYQNALVLELRKLDLPVRCQHPLKVRYEGVVVGEFAADLLINERLIVELKSARAIDPSHEAQLVNYLSAINLDVGLILNFGAGSLQFRTKTRLYRPRGTGGEDVAV